MTRRKGELSPAGIDHGWPHQVALPADQVIGANYKTVHDFCRDLSLCSRGHSVRGGSIEYVVFCFTEYPRRPAIEAMLIIRPYLFGIIERLPISRVNRSSDRTLRFITLSQASMG
jgi:hypothetical protein